MYHTHHARHGRGQWRGCGAWKHAANFDRSGFFKQFRGDSASAPVNIRETKDYYELFVFAPGLSKDAFNISIADDVLIISAVAGTDEESARSKWMHHEYNRGGFERRFELNNKIETDGITASYTDGVLEVTLPKAPDTAAKDISIS